MLAVTGCAPQLLLQLDDVAALGRCERDLADGRQDVVTEHAADSHLRLRLEPDLDMLFQILQREVGHGRSAVEPGGERQGHRFLARLDARNDESGPLSGPVGMEHVMPADRHPLRPVRSPRLGDVDLAAGRIDPDPEAGKVPVPEYRVARDLECRHGAVGEGFLLHCHRRFPSRRLGTARHDVGADAVASPGGGRLLGVAYQMGVFRGGADPGVTKQPADHRQALAERQRPRGVGVPYIL